MSLFWFVSCRYSAQYEENTVESANQLTEDFNPNASAAYVNNIPINSNAMAAFDHHGGGENFSGPQYVYDGSDDDDETYWYFLGKAQGNRGLDA